MSKCNKGKPCGSTCIEQSKKCQATLPSKLCSGLEKASGSISQVQAREKRAQGQSLEGSALDFPRLHQRALAWAKENGLGSPEDVQPGHDEVHVLVRDYLGKSAKAIGALIGEPSKGGPTNLEEVLVEAFETLSKSKAKRENSEAFFRESAKDSFGLSQRLGVLPKEHLYNRSPEKAVGVAIKYLTAISNRPDFDLFLATVKEARRAGKEYMRQS